MAKISKKAMTDFWLENYARDGHCGLCGNRGRIDTRGMKTSSGIECGGRFICLCPNGQAIRSALTEGRE